MLINQVNDVPHDRTPLFGEAIRSAVRFGRSSPGRENGFVGRGTVCRRGPAMKRLHGIESTGPIGPPGHVGGFFLAVQRGV
jgi:hypothetical protein